MLDPKVSGTLLELGIPTDAEWEEAEQITCPGPHKYFLDVNINNYVVPMLIDSGSECTFINQNTWRLVGKPELCNPLYESRIPGGNGIKLLGEFSVKIELHVKTHYLPVLVTKSMTGSNVIGLTWLSQLNINWNAIFHENCIPNKNCFCPAKDPEIIVPRPSVEIVMDGIPVQITIDTGATNTIIDLSMWKKIGCPALEKTTIQPITDFNGKQIEIRGEAMIRVYYQGKIAILPALVANASLLPVIGTNWSTVIKFNFNAIFANILSTNQFHKRNGKEPTTSRIEVSSKPDLIDPVNKTLLSGIKVTTDKPTLFKNSIGIISPTTMNFVVHFWEIVTSRFRSFVSKIFG